MPFSGTTDAIPKTREPRPEDVQEQLSKILTSKSFLHSTVLQSFLRYVTDQTIAGRALTVSEYTIATRALGRGEDFDSTSDTIVRTQAYRLRQKLSEYYRSEGLWDPVRIEIPKGHYVPSFSVRTQAESPEKDLDRSLAPALPGAPDVAKNPNPGKHDRSRWPMLALFLCGLALGLLLRFIPSTSPKVQARQDSASAVNPFWHSFLLSDRQPIITYTNSVNLITDSEDQISYNEGATGDRGTALDRVIAARIKKKHDLSIPGNLLFEDSFTGVGDVLAATAVSSAITRAGGQPSLKRGRLLSTYDLDTHNVVFIGSPFVNEVLNDLPGKTRFVFKRGAHLWQGHIDDLTPAAGKPRSYSVERSADTGVLLTDYAVVSCLRGLNQNREILMVAGLTTSGTAAAAQFLTSSEGLADMSRLLRRSEKDKRGWPKYFEFLIKAQLSHGLDVVHAECIVSCIN